MGSSKNLLDERVSTGIKGLDELIEGGFPKESIIVVAGEPGAGKTLFGLSFVYEGARKGEKCCYVTLSEPPDALIKAAYKIGLKKFPDFVNSGDIKLIHLPPTNFYRVVRAIHSEHEVQNFSRLVIDSLTDVVSDVLSIGNIPAELELKGMLFPSLVAETLLIRKVVHTFVSELRKLRITTLLLSEAPATESEYLTRDKVSEFLADGVVVLRHLNISADMGRAVQIVKLRRTKIPTALLPFRISDTGLEVQAPTPTGPAIQI